MERWRELRYVAEVRSRSDFVRFLDVLMQADRKPIVVFSVAEGAPGPAVDVEAIEQQLEDSVHLYVLPPEVTFWLTDALGDRSLSVHSGWVRVYPSAPKWKGAPHLAPSFPPAPSNSRRAVARIVEAALTAAFQDGHVDRAAVPVHAERTVGRVRDVVSPTQAIVVDDRGRQAILRTNSLVPGLAAERVVRPGQRFAGLHTPVGLLGEFVPDLVTDDAHRRAVEFVGDGVVTSVRAASVSPDRAVLLLHPTVEVDLNARARVDLTLEVTEGEVVTVEIVFVDGEFILSFSDEEPQPAMSALPGGPPWIVPEIPDGRDGTSEQPVVTAAVAATGGVLDVGPEVLEWYIMQLLDENEELNGTVKRLKSELRRSRRFSVPVVYSDPEEQLRLELKLSYLSRVDEVRRAELPWPKRFDFGADFVGSVDDLVRAGGIRREKIIDVCAEVLCGLARELPSRAVKEWSADGQQLRRTHDGAVAMRVRLQTGTSAARRMRYWKLPSGEIELDLVCVHDSEL